MRIKTTLGKERLAAIEYGSVVMYKGFHCIVINGPFDNEAKKLPIVRLMDGQLIQIPKNEELHVITDVYLATEHTD